MPAVFEKDHVGNIVNNFLNLFRVDFSRLVLAARRLRNKLWTAVTDLLFFDLV
jgi:hypothetical protein